jgi:GNAT superfamily N-acetyltransferase
MRQDESKSIDKDALVDLYASVGWSSYTKQPDTLKRAIENSTCVLTLWDDDVLVALARCLSDDAVIMYLQDVLVRPTHQRQGHGVRLVGELLRRYQHVRQIVLLTDDDPGQHIFYRRLGLENTKTLANGKLNAFALIRG